MTSYALSQDLFALSQESDRRFRRLVAGFLIPALIAGVGIPLIKLTTLQRPTEMLPARYAKLINQTQPEVVEPKPPPPKPLVKAKPEPTREQKVAKAREKASKMMSSFDALAELRDADLPTTTNAKLSSSVISSKSGRNSSFAADAEKGSTGIGRTGVVQRGSTTGLGDRSTRRIDGPTSNASPEESRMAGRTIEEINLVIDRNKGALNTIYMRERRNHPDIQGVITVRMTIAPSGAVTRCTLIHTDFNLPEFEQKIVSRVLLLNFGAKDVGEVTIDYPLNFLPS